MARGIESGTIGGPRNDELAETVSRAAGLASLTALDLSNRTMSSYVFHSLLRSPHLAGLRELSLRYQFLDVPPVRGFADPAVRFRLAALDLNGRNEVRRDGLAHLLAAPCLAGLARLGLAGCKLTSPDGELFAEAAWRATLTALDLGDNRLQASGLRRLLAAEWPRLRELGLARAGLKPAAVEVLASWPGLPRLLTLDLRGNDLGDEAEARLRGAGLPAEARLMVGGA
jgi:hypothetical protein